jgi:hypothetical protein
VYTRADGKYALQFCALVAEICLVVYDLRQCSEECKNNKDATTTTVLLIPFVDMLLGTDCFVSFRIYVSYCVIGCNLLCSLNILLLITATKINCGGLAWVANSHSGVYKFVAFMDPVVHCRFTGINCSHGEPRFGSHVQRKCNWKALCILLLDLASGSGFAFGF